MIKKAFVLIFICTFLSGCTSLVLEERKRALYESYEKGDINKVQYVSMKNELEKKQAELKKQGVGSAKKSVGVSSSLSGGGNDIK